MSDRDRFDLVIGRLDRCLSEFLALYAEDLDEPDRQTLKHHADDLIGVGQKMREELARPVVLNGPAELSEERRKFLEENPPWS